MTNSTVLGIPYLASQQATPEIPHNQALYMIEAMLRGVKAIQNAPPGVPADGDTYIVGTAGSGAWLNKNNCVAIYMSNAWRFIPGFDTLGAQIAMGAAQEGMSLWNIALDARYTWTGAAWSVATGISAAGVTNTPAGGISATNVQAAINELDTEKYTAAANTLPIADLVNAAAQGDFIGRNTAGAGAWEDITSAQAKTRLAITGADVANTPAGNIAATNVQAAINELDTEKAGIALANLFTAIQNITATVTAAKGSSQLILQSNDAGVVGAVLEAYHNSASPAGSDLPLIFNIYGKDSGGADQVYAQQLVQIVSPTAGAEGGRFSITTVLAGAVATRLNIAAGVYTNNATSGDMGIDTFNAGGFYSNGVLAVDNNALLRTRVFTVATLPAAAGITGALCRVSDSLVAPVYNGVAAGGGTTFAQVTSDGTNWRYC